MILKRLFPDPVLIFTVLLLNIFGILTVFSVQLVPAFVEGIDLRDLRKPVLFLIASFLGFLLVSFMSRRFDYRVLSDKRWAYGIFFFSFFLLVFVLIKKWVTGQSVNRWLIGTSVQPSELSKLAIVIFLSYYAYSKERLDQKKYIIWVFVLVILQVVAVALQPDKGTALLFLVLTALLLFFGGAPLKKGLLISSAFVFPLAFLVLLIKGSYVIDRIKAWIDPFADNSDKNYQIIQAIASFVQGGFFGVGYGKGFQKIGNLTQADTDYVLATIGEEFGLFGTSMVIGLYIILFWRLLKIAIEVEDRFGSLLVVGITFSIVLTALVNISVALNVLPPKGIPLPFVSYGLSNLLVSFLSLGIVGSVYRRHLG